ncbi:MAG: PEGA domain-containing protein [Myxococcota bacterium]|nr:PEGA domain-containing protein [Myxococcota bacterium]
MNQPRTVLGLILATVPLRIEAAETEIVAPASTATILIDGELAGETPLRLDALSAGSHELSLKSTRFGPVIFTQTIEIPEEGAVTITVSMDARTLDVATADALKPEVAEPATEETAAAPSDDAQAAASAPSTEAAEGLGGLYISADQAGARIFLDSEDTGKVTPSLLEGIAAGAHVVRVQTDCARAEQSIALRKELIERMEMVLEGGTGDLQITAEPEGARVFLNGEEVGQAPLLLEDVACQEHAVVLRAPDHLESRHTLLTPAFEITTLETTMAEEQYGTLVVAITPLDAAVFIDSIEAGSGPMTLEGVGAGTHAISARLDGYESHAADIAVAPDAVTRVDIALEPASSGGNGPLPRILLNTAVTGAGGYLAVDALRSYATASDNFETYLSEPDDDVAAAYYTSDVQSYRSRAVLEGIGSAVLLGSSAVLWMRTDFAVSATPRQLTLHHRW